MINIIIALFTLILLYYNYYLLIYIYSFLCYNVIYIHIYTSAIVNMNRGTAVASGINYLQTA